MRNYTCAPHGSYVTCSYCKRLQATVNCGASIAASAAAARKARSTPPSPASHTSSAQSESGSCPHIYFEYFFLALSRVPAQWPSRRTQGHAAVGGRLKPGTRVMQVRARCQCPLRCNCQDSAPPHNPGNFKRTNVSASGAHLLPASTPARKLPGSSGAHSSSGSCGMVWRHLRRVACASMMPG